VKLAPVAIPLAPWQILLFIYLFIEQKSFPLFSFINQCLVHQRYLQQDFDLPNIITVLLRGYGYSYLLVAL